MAEHMEDGTIDVDPEYQREVVWTGKTTSLSKAHYSLTYAGLQLSG
jgi:hypothetical protein